jgi:hypothetical protein
MTPSDDRPVRWGVLATGGIARAFAGDLARQPGGEVVAVGSALLAIGAGKAVLVEKPFAMDAAQAREMIDAARGQGTFLMEAMWTRFLPHTGCRPSRSACPSTVVRPWHRTDLPRGSPLPGGDFVGPGGGPSWPARPPARWLSLRQPPGREAHGCLWQIASGSGQVLFLAGWLLGGCHQAAWRCGARPGSGWRRSASAAGWGPACPRAGLLPHWGWLAAWYTMISQMARPIVTTMGMTMGARADPVISVLPSGSVAGGPRRVLGTGWAGCGPLAAGASGGGHASTVAVSGARQ